MTIMKKKNLFLAVAMGAALVGCTDDLVDNSANQNLMEEPSAIMFGGNTNAVTRSTGGDAAAALLNKKIVFFGSKTVEGTAKPIFDNYVLTYDASKTGTTETNVAGWEYVGNTSLNGAEQDTKYWDYTASQYDFVAVSGLANGEAITDASSGMKINVADADAMSSIYIANRETVEPKNYNQTVTFEFRRLGARMRVGFYETVPGYAIKNLVFYYVGAESGSKTLGVGGAFPQSGKYNVTYDATTGEATVKFNGGSNKMGWASAFGQLQYTSAASKAGDAALPYIDENGTAVATAVNSFLATNPAQPTFAKGSYTIDGVANTESVWKPILPNENNSLKMQLRVDYTLVALDGSGDVINVRDAYVSVPVEYCKWKPNYAYTYIFKISDKSNGYTGKGGGGATSTTGDGRDPEPNTGGDSNPLIDQNTGEEIPPYVPDPKDPNAYITDPDTGEKIPNPDVPLVPNPEYPGNTSGDAPKGDQHDPSNPVPTPTDQDGNPDKTNPAGLYPITFDAVVEDVIDNSQETITTVSTPSITTTSATSSVTTNNEYKVNEAITLAVQDGTTPDAWEYIYAGTEAITEKTAQAKYANSTWTTLGTAAKATLTPNAEGYYVVRVKVGTEYGYKVIKVVA